MGGETVDALQQFRLEIHIHPRVHLGSELNAVVGVHAGLSSDVAHALLQTFSADVVVIPDQLVSFTWGGIDGLKIGQSIVTFILKFDGRTTVVGLNHTHLPNSALNMHRLGWMQFGLSRLKAIAEGACPRGTYLGDIAEHREDTPYLSRFPVPRVGVTFHTRLKPHLVHAIPRKKC